MHNSEELNTLDKTYTSNACIDDVSVNNIKLYSRVIPSFDSYQWYDLGESTT